MDSVIQIDALTHTFGDRRAVDGLSLTVAPGEVFGLLGPNGAGKTTTVRLLNGLYLPTAGKMRVLGLDPAAQGADVRARTGVLTETPALYERLTAFQNLEFFARLADMPEAERAERIHELLDFFGLENRANDRVGTFSKGMKQRLALARALLTQPALLFLDEPTSGLDPEAAQQVHELMDEIRGQDHHTVFLCTHNLYEAQRLCDRLAVMNQGRLLAVGTLEELRQRVAPGLWVEAAFLQPLPAGTVQSLETLPGVLQVRPQALSLRLQVQEEAVIPVIVTNLARGGAQIVRIEPQPISLEDIYFSLLNEQVGGEK